MNDRSVLGEKQMWNLIKALPGCGQKPVAAPPVMRHPVTGATACTPAVVLEAQVSHTRQLGDHAAYAASNPDFDRSWATHVEEQVRQYALELSDDVPAADDPLNGPITVGEVADALATLQNGKAAGPINGIPNELLKYGGHAMA